tara:strand:- start:732 stop:1124 length:393 start_codon:yes stop_codon:yes gene_type:complete
MTLYIENEDQPIRVNDTVITLYENIQSSQASIKSKNPKKSHDGVIHRSFFNRVFYIDTDAMAQVYILSPQYTQKLAQYFFSTQSNVNIEEEYKNYEFLELSLTSGNYLFVPRGYWIYFDKGVQEIYEVQI